MKGRGPRSVAEGLDFPTSLAFDGDGVPYVAESGLSLGGASQGAGGKGAGGRVLRIERDGRPVVVHSGLRAPVNGLTFHDGCFYVAEGGYPGRLSRLAPTGERSTVLDGLPGFGNYHTNMALAGPDGKLYFSQGAMTNSGVVGLDGYDLAWLRTLPHNWDVPGLDVELAGANYETENPLNGDGGQRVRTGAFSPFATATEAGQKIDRRLPCTASVMRCNVDGSDLELVAWGLRNAYGLAFLPDGRLLATDQGADDRGSRPVGNAPDLLVEVRQGAWYGWPDFVGHRRVTDERFRPRRGPALQPLLAHYRDLPRPEPALLELPVNAAATKMAVIPDGAPRWPGQLLVACFGDEMPMTAPAGPRVGRSLVRVDPSDWSLDPLATGLLLRPIDVAVDAGGETVWVLDFGDFEMTASGAEARARSGALRTFPLTTL